MGEFSRKVDLRPVNGMSCFNVLENGDEGFEDTVALGRDIDQTGALRGKVGYGEGPGAGPFPRIGEDSRFAVS